jgi:hypothetical protein
MPATASSCDLRSEAAVSRQTQGNVPARDDFGSQRFDHSILAIAQRGRRGAEDI